MENQINKTKEEEEIEKTLHKYARTLNDGDFEEWISMWIENGIQMPPNTYMRAGKSSISNFMKPMFDSMNFNMELKDVGPVKICDSLGSILCTYKFTATMKNTGEEIIIEPDGKALGVYEKQSDGGWKIVFDCFNSNLDNQ